MKQKDLLLILVPTFVLTILWVIFSIYHNHVTSTIKDPLTIQIIPIQGKFDTAEIAKIKERKRVDPLFDSTLVNLSSLPTPTPTPEAEEVASESAETQTGGITQ